jgi:hypothetical protein
LARPADDGKKKMRATIQMIMKTGFMVYEAAHKLPTHVRKAARAVMKCRTAELGGHMQVCPEGHYERHWYNSCRHRICPQCNWLQLEKWLTRQKDRLLACGYYHMIFTLPHDLNIIWTLNVRPMTSILFRAAHDTLFEFFKDERHIGAKPGVIAALHTWTQSLLQHPHIHALVTEGGLGKDGQWVSARRKGYLLPVRAVMKVFRGKTLAYMDKAIARDELTLPEGMSQQRWENLRNKLGRLKWNVHIRERYAYGSGVLTYLARYIRGGPISNNRIMSHTERGVTFGHRAPEGGKAIPMTLTEDAFIERYLQHVPARYAKVVRCWGLYAPRAAEELSLCRSYLGQGPIEETSDDGDWQEYCASNGDQHPEVCPICGLRLRRGVDIAPARQSLQPANKEAIKWAA